MTVPFFNIGCVSQTSYGYNKRASTYRLPALKGRPRYRLRDTWASYVVTLQWEFTPSQYAAFQTFWYDQINAGSDTFEMRLMMDDYQVFDDGTEIYQVHAVEGFNSTFSQTNLWTVRLQVEVAGGFRVGIVVCPVIFAGTPDSPAPNSYYPGTPDNLATDIIAPCPGVVG